MSDKPFGVDVASGDGIINWDVMKANPLQVNFTGIRTGISWGYVDSKFPMNWAGAKRIGLYRNAYHVLYPDQNAQTQMDNMFRQFPGNDYGELPTTLDVELDRGCGKNQIADTMYKCLVIMQTRTGKVPMIYTRKAWIEEFLGTTLWMNNYWWWLALYLPNKTPEHPGPIVPPKGVDISKVLIHQTAEMIPLVSLGTQSKAVDFDRWQGDLVSLIKFAGGVVPIPQPSLDQRVSKLEGEARIRGWVV